MRKNTSINLHSIFRRSLVTSTAVSSKPIKLNPWYIGGFTDGEGCWGLSVSKDSKRIMGYNLSPKFIIGVHKVDIALLERIQVYFGVGKIYYGPGNLVRFQVTSLEELINVIIPFYDKYPLVSQKRADFLLFKEIIEIIKTKEHMTKLGFEKILNIKAALNTGNSEALKEAFPAVSPVARPTVGFNGIPDPHWLAGFSDADGCFFISIYDSPKSKLGLAIQLSYIVTQHIRDKELLEGISTYLGCGRCSLRKEAGDFKVVSVTDIIQKIIPFFTEFPLQGVKRLNYNDLCAAAEIMKAKRHLTEAGLNEIKLIKSGMNTGRM